MSHTTTTIKQAVADLLQEAVADLATLWDNRVSSGLSQATSTINGILLGEKGYTAAQIAAWDELDSYTLDLSLFFIFSKSPVQTGITWEQIKSWDRRKDLRGVVLVDDTSAIGGASVSGGALDDGEFIPTALDDEDTYVEDDT